MTKFSCLTTFAVAGFLAASPISSPFAVADGHSCDDKAIKLGEKQFRKCKACHKAEDGKNGIGPHLFGVVGRGIADVQGYSYSGPMVEFGKDDAKVWDFAALDAFLTKPKKYVKGTKMTFNGFKKEERRIGVICYLEKVGGS